MTASAPTPSAASVIFGNLWSDLVGTLTDGNTQEDGSDLTATALWNDNQTTPCTLVPLGNGIFQLFTRRIFNFIGPISCTVSVSDVGGQSVSTDSKRHRQQRHRRLLRRRLRVGETG